VPILVPIAMRENGRTWSLSSEDFLTGSGRGTATIFAESKASDRLAEEEEEEEIAAAEKSIEATFHAAARERPSRDDAVWAAPGTHSIPTIPTTAVKFWILKLDIEILRTLAETVRL